MGFRFRENENEFVPSVTRRGVHGAAMNAQNVCQAADGCRSHEMTVGIIDHLQLVQVKQHDGEGAPGAFVALDFRVEGIEKPAVVGESGERIGDRQLANVLIGALVFAKFGGQRHGRYGHNANEGLQQQQRRVLRPPCKWSKSVHRAPGGNRRQGTNGGGRLTATKPERRPDQKRNAKVFEGIILHGSVKTAAEDDPHGEEQSCKQKSKLHYPRAGPMQAGILPPEEHEGSDHHGTNGVPDPPG